MSDRSCDTSRALTEVRTVRSRARSAIRQLEVLPILRERDRFDVYGEPDPDEAEMIEALRSVVTLLDRWKR